MKPRFIAVSIAAAFAGLSAPANAGPFDRNEVKAIAYVSLPFGGVSHSQEAPILGFALNHHRRERTDGFGYRPSLFQHTPASAARSLMDVRFNTQKQNRDRFRVGGVDALTYTTRMKADGTTEAVATLAEIPAVAIVAGVVVGAAVIHEATKKDNPPAPAAPAPSPGPIGGGVGIF